MPNNRKNIYLARTISLIGSTLGQQRQYEIN